MLEPHAATKRSIDDIDEKMVKEMVEAHDEFMSMYSETFDDQRFYELDQEYLLNQEGNGFDLIAVAPPLSGASRVGRSVAPSKRATRVFFGA